jgi:hypothetical protein
MLLSNICSCALTCITEQKSKSNITVAYLNWFKKTTVSIYKTHFPAYLNIAKKKGIVLDNGTDR